MSGRLQQRAHPRIRSEAATLWPRLRRVLHLGLDQRWEQFLPDVQEADSGYSYDRVRDLFQYPW